jgi:hypothetical protein
MNLCDLPTDIQKHIYSYADSETTWIADQVSKLNANSNGWIIGRNSKAQKFGKQEYLDILDAMKRIPDIIQTGKQYRVQSYGGKHVLERYRKQFMKNGYISNGCFICAMILLGYQYKKPYNLNLEFKAKYIKN